MGSPLHLPHEWECSATTCSRILQRFIGFLLPRIWFSDWSDLSDGSENQSWALPLIGSWRGLSYSWFFAPFVKIRGLKTSTIFLLFPFQEGHKIEHERERAPHPAFLSVGFLIASTDTIRMSADSIRKPADRIRKLTGGIRLQTSRKMKKSSFFEVKNYKNRKILPKTILQNPPIKKKFGRSTLFSS